MNGLAALLITQYRNGLLLDDRKRDEALALWTQPPAQPQPAKVEPADMWHKGARASKARKTPRTPR